MPVLMLAAACAGLQLALVTIVSACFRRVNVYGIVIGVAVVTAPVVMWASPAITGALSGEGRVAAGFLHLALGGFFFHFMTLPDRSVTLRMLVELRDAPRHELSPPELNARYSVRTMIESRLEQLAAAEFVAVDPDRTVHLRPRGRRLARFVAAGRRLFDIVSAN